jgi:hypothetical protein
MRPEGHTLMAVLAPYNGADRLTYRKQLLPTYNVFDERRHFEPGPDRVQILTASASSAIGSLAPPRSLRFHCLRAFDVDSRPKRVQSWSNSYASCTRAHALRQTTHEAFAADGGVPGMGRGIRVNATEAPVHHTFGAVESAQVCSKLAVLMRSAGVWQRYLPTINGLGFEGVAVVAVACDLDQVSL